MSVLAIIEARSRAVGAGDPDALIEFVSDDVVTFDVIPPLVSHGKHASRARAVEWLESYEGRVTWDASDIVIHSSGDVAFCHFVSRVQGMLKTGETVDMWFRTTLGFREGADGWRIVHDHSSDPFDPDSGKALTDLRP